MPAHTAPAFGPDLRKARRAALPPRAERVLVSGVMIVASNSPMGPSRPVNKRSFDFSTGGTDGEGAKGW
jgi:hypothetical protein